MTSPGTMSLTLQQPLNNVSRLSMMALACALGGAGEAMTTPLHDEAHALPSEDAIRVGAAIQHIVAPRDRCRRYGRSRSRARIRRDSRTRMEDAALAEMAKIDAMGGTLKAIELGYFQRVLGHEQFDRNRAIEEGRRKLVASITWRLPTKQREIDIFRSTRWSRIPRSRACRSCGAERDRHACRRCSRPSASSRDGSKPRAADPRRSARRRHAWRDLRCMRDVFGIHSPDAQTSGV
jgi:methylmalonyl-CoA mutase N-terminal domain/subunit